MGVELADKGAVDAAISSYKQALKIMPDYAEAYNNLGLVLMKKGQIATAKKRILSAQLKSNKTLQQGILI
jgi:Flp pilus assembly protein TadD